MKTFENDPNKTDTKEEVLGGQEYGRMSETFQNH